MLNLIHNCSIARNTSTGTVGRRTLTTLAPAVPCLAIPMQARAAQQNGFDIGRGYDFYFAPGIDVKVKDQLTQGDSTYTISGIEIFDVPTVGHVHAVAQQEIGS